MNFDLAPSVSDELGHQTEGSPCVYPSTPLQRPYFFSAASTASIPSRHSSSPPSSPSLVSTTGSGMNNSFITGDILNVKITAANTSSDEMFPPTPNSKLSFHVANNGAASGPQTRSCSPENSDLPHRWTASFEDQCLFDRLSGWSVDFNDTSETISERVGIV
jgi:hypothetical protein